MKITMLLQYVAVGGFTIRNILGVCSEYYIYFVMTTFYESVWFKILWSTSIICKVDHQSVTFLLDVSNFAYFFLSKGKVMNMLTTYNLIRVVVCLLLRDKEVTVALQSYLQTLTGIKI